jgi:pimeloyl-ACP methyl ester carboxylesterase
MRRRDLLGSVASRLGGVVDEVILRTTMQQRFQRHRPPTMTVHAPDAPAPSDRRGLLAEAIAFYRRPEIAADFFAEPESRARPFRERRGRLDDGEIVDLKWASGFSPRWDRVRADYLSHEPNRFAHARLYRHDGEPRGTVVCLHGYRGGAYLFEERAFPVRWFYQLGFDVVLFQLPFHGHRAGRVAPVWPSINVARTNEGFAHAIHDLRALRLWLRDERGERALVVTGMSLGGYTTALWATVEPIDFVAPMIPVANFPELLWAHGEGRPERARAEREGITLEMMRQSMECHTPLLRTPLASGDRVLVLSAAGDRIAPPEHGARLAAHFSAEELRFDGGHVLQIGRASAFRALGRRLAQLGLIDPR